MHSGPVSGHDRSASHRLQLFNSQIRFTSFSGNSNVNACLIRVARIEFATLIFTSQGFALFRAGAFVLLPCVPKSHMRLLPHLQGGSRTEPEPETGTVGTVFPETESGTGTAGTVFQEPKPEPSFPFKLY